MTLQVQGMHAGQMQVMTSVLLCKLLIRMCCSCITNCRAGRMAPVQYTMPRAGC
jgi:hypothetical protein